MEKINNKLRLSKQKLTSLPFRKIAPNIVTMLALCAGVTSIRYSIAENWAMAVICIFLAAFFDGLDGRVARMLKGSTKFGAELDSLSDFVSFGVAPAILMFQWTLFDLPKFGWFFCLLFAIGMSMRLARFNTMLDEDPQPGLGNYADYDDFRFSRAGIHSALKHFLQRSDAGCRFSDGQPHSDRFDQKDESADLYVYSDDAGCGFVCQLYHQSALDDAGRHDGAVCLEHSGRNFCVSA